MRGGESNELEIIHPICGNDFTSLDQKLDQMLDKVAQMTDCLAESMRGTMQVLKFFKSKFKARACSQSALSLGESSQIGNVAMSITFQSRFFGIQLDFVHRTLRLEGVPYSSSLEGGGFLYER